MIPEDGNRLTTLSVRDSVRTGNAMATLNTTSARAQLYDLIDRVAESHEPVEIKGKRRSAVLVSGEDWRAVQETLYLLSIPGMRASIRKGLKTRVSRCRRDPGW